LALDAVPVGTAGELLERGLALGDLGRRDPELIEASDLLVDLPKRRLGGLTLLLQRLGLLLQDPGEPRRRDPTESSRACRATTPLKPSRPGSRFRDLRASVSCAVPLINEARSRLLSSAASWRSP